MHETRRVISSGKHIIRDTRTECPHTNLWRLNTRARPSAYALKLYTNDLRSERRTDDGRPDSVHIWGMGCVFFRFAPANLAPATVYTHGIFSEKAKTGQTKYRCGSIRLPQHSSTAFAATPT